jgi:hypothetical protein
MKNVNMKVKGSTLTITIDLSEEHGMSKSGKTIIVASTAGNKAVEGTDIMIGVNAYKYKDSK